MNIVAQNSLAKQYVDFPLSDNAKSALSKSNSVRLIVMSFYKDNPANPFNCGLIFSDEDGVVLHGEWVLPANLKRENDDFG